MLSEINIFGVETDFVPGGGKFGGGGSSGGWQEEKSDDWGIFESFKRQAQQPQNIDCNCDESGFAWWWLLVAAAGSAGITYLIMRK